MKCVRCDKNESSVVIENDDGTVEPVCEGCYLNVLNIECPACGTEHIEGVMCPASFPKHDDGTQKAKHAIESYAEQVEKLKKDMDREEKQQRKKANRMKLNVKCEKCRYWSPCVSSERKEPGVWKTECGECRFNPPVFLSHREANFDNHGYSPVTKINCWCGKFKKEDK